MSQEIKKRKSKRRGNGEGSIFQRSNGRWVATMAVGYNANGKRQRKSVYGKTKKDVQDQLNQLQQRKSTGTLAATTKLTVGQYVDTWLENVVRLTVRPSTHRRYARLIRLQVKPQV